MCIVSRSAVAFTVTLVTIVRFGIAWKLVCALRYASGSLLVEESSADLNGRGTTPLDDRCFFSTKEESVKVPCYRVKFQGKSVACQL